MSSTETFGSATAGSASGPIIIAGGSGFLGGALATHLAALGRPIVVLSRRPPKPSGPWRHVGWDARSMGEWRQELNGASALINRVGRSIDCIKTPAHQDETLRSRVEATRVEATRVLGWAVRSVDAPPPVPFLGGLSARTSIPDRRGCLRRAGS